MVVAIADGISASVLENIVSADSGQNGGNV